MANSKIKGIIVEIGGDTSGLQKALTNANKLANSFSKELKAVNKALKFDPSNTELLTQKEKTLNNEIASLERNLRYLTEQYDDVNSYVSKGNILTEEQTKKYNALAREIVVVKANIEKTKKEISDFGSVTSQQIAVAGKKVEEFGNKVGKIGDKFKGLSVAASAVTGGITKVAIDFESAWTGVTKTVDGTEEQLSKVKHGILDLSKVTASSAGEIAQVAENAGQLGVATENVVDFTETMVRLGDSTNVSADEASSAIAKLYNIMGADINTVDNFGSALVALGNNAATTEADILNMATRIAASGNQIGLSNQEVLALATTLSSVGMEAEAGGSAISAVMTQIDKDVALNTKNLKNWASTAGMTSKEFSNLWKTDTMSAIQAVVKGMGDASSSGQNLNVILDELGVTSLRQTDTMKRLSNASEIMADMVSLSNTSWQKNTALIDESNKRYETTESKLVQLKSSFTELAVQLGEKMLPKFQNIIDTLKSVVDWFSNLNDSSQNVILAFLGIAAAIAPVLKIFSSVTVSIGKIMENAPKIVSGISKIKTAVLGLKTMLSGLVATIGSISAPVLVVVGVLATLVAGFTLLYNKCEWFRNGIKGIFSNIRDIIVNVFEGIKKFVTKTVPDSFEKFVNKVKQIPSQIKTAINKIGNFFSNLGNTILETLKNSWENIVSFFTEGIPNFIQYISESISELPYKIGYILGYILGNIIKFGTNTWNWVTTEIPKIIGVIIEWFESLPEKIGFFLGFVVGKIVVFASELYTKFIKLKDDIMQKIVEFGASVLAWITINLPIIIENIVTWFSTLPDRIWEWLLNVIQKVIEWGTNTYNTANAWISKTITNIIDWFKKLPSNIWNWLVETFNKTVQWLQDMWDLIQKKVPEICNSIVDFFKEIPGKMLDIGKNIVEGLWNGIVSAKDWLFGKVTEFATGILDGMKAALDIHSPSKLFRDEVGRYIAEGIGVGFIKNIPNVMGDMKKTLIAEVGKISTNMNIDSNIGGLDKKLNNNVTDSKVYNISMPIYTTQKLTETEMNAIFNAMNKRFGLAL